MANTTFALPKKRRELKKNQAIAVMVIGGILAAQAFFFSTEVGSSAHTTKIVVGIIGFFILIVGAALRPIKAAPEGK
jgi:hypothetical protein